MSTDESDSEPKPSARGDLRREIDAAKAQFDAARAQLDAANERLERKVGRNLPAAISIAIVLAGGIVGTLVWSSLAFAIFVSVFAGVGVLELATALRLDNYKLARWPLAVLGSLVTFSAYWWGIGQALLVVLAAVVVHSVILLALRRRHVLINAVAGAFTLVYVAWLLGFVVALAHNPDGRMWVGVFVALVVINDTMAYVFGLNFGKHPLVPRISPKKTWEGLIGAAVSVVVAGAVAFAWALGLSPWLGALCGLAVVFTATLGDLVESVIKRELGTKDMSNWLPGHGGLLDRIDALLLTVPLAFIAYLLLY